MANQAIVITELMSSTVSVDGYTWDGVRNAFSLTALLSTASACTDKPSCAVAVVTGESVHAICDVLKQIKKSIPQIFTIVHSDQVSKSARGRLNCFSSGAQMLAHSPECIAFGLRTVLRQYHLPATMAVISSASNRLFTCPECGLAGLSEYGLHSHFPLYHSMENTREHDCPICGKEASKFRAFAVHLHNEHGPVEEREPNHPMFSAFAWVVCCRPSDRKMLLCHEPAAISGGKPNYWFPAGRVDKGETFVMAAEREALEEAGVHVKVTGLLLCKLGCRLVPRIVLYAEPVDDPTKGNPKSVPDFESCGACWLDVTALDELTESDYRSSGTAELYRAVASGRLSPLPLGTPSFAELERMVQCLTREEKLEVQAWKTEIKRVWDLLKKDYAMNRLQME